MAHTYVCTLHVKRAPRSCSCNKNACKRTRKYARTYVRTYSIANLARTCVFVSPYSFAIPYSTTLFLSSFQSSRKRGGRRNRLMCHCERNCKSTCTRKCNTNALLVMGLLKCCPQSVLQHSTNTYVILCNCPMQFAHLSGRVILCGMRSHLMQDSGTPFFCWRDHEKLPIKCGIGCIRTLKRAHARTHA